MEKAQSFEVTEYSDEHEIPGHIQGAISEIVRDQVREVPSVGVQVSFMGNLMKLSYHSYEHSLHLRKRDVEDRAKKGLDETLKNIKKKIKGLSGVLPTFTEKKDMASTAAQKVSLNDRYMFSSWRFYEIE